MKEKYYEELLKKYYNWKMCANRMKMEAGISKEEYEARAAQYTKLTRALCEWLKIFEAATEEEWQEDKKKFAYLFAVDEKFLVFLNNFMKTKKAN